MKETQDMKSLKIATPGGVIEAITVESDEYPCIQVFIDGNLVAVLEHDVHKQDFITRFYSRDKDEPVVSAAWKDGETDVYQ